jgi:hypothetical protein
VKEITAHNKVPHRTCSQDTAANFGHLQRGEGGVGVVYKYVAHAHYAIVLQGRVIREAERGAERCTVDSSSYCDDVFSIQSIVVADERGSLRRERRQLMHHLHFDAHPHRHTCIHILASMRLALRLRGLAPRLRLALLGLTASKSGICKVHRVVGELKR